MATSAPRRTVDLIDRRVGLLFGVFLLLLVIAIARAGYLGLFAVARCAAAANDQQVQTTPIPAARGEITDRNGVPFALSEPAEEIDRGPVPDRQDLRDPQAVAAKLAPLLGMTRPPPWPTSPSREPATSSSRDRIRRQAANAIMAFKSAASRHQPISGPSAASYPRGTELGQVLGWAGSGGHGDGLEYRVQQAAGRRHRAARTVIDAKGNAISVDTTKTMVPGKTLALTISAPLQSEVEQVLAGVGEQYKPAGATAIVTDPQTDQILALANWPARQPQQCPSPAWHARSTVRSPPPRIRPWTCRTSRARPSRRSPSPARCRTTSSRPIHRCSTFRRIWSPYGTRSPTPNRTATRR